MSGRKRVYQSNAERQRAYRARRQNVTGAALRFASYPLAASQSLRAVASQYGTAVALVAADVADAVAGERDGWAFMREPQPVRRY